VLGSPASNNRRLTSGYTRSARDVESGNISPGPCDYQSQKDAAASRLGVVAVGMPQLLPRLKFKPRYLPGDL
jgi:hypothetical protein